MKVIITSNFNLDYYEEELCSPTNLSKKEAEDLAEKLNKPLDQYSTIWYIVVEDDYSLCPGFAP